MRDAYCLTSVSDGEVAKPLRLQRYKKKMTLANKSAIFLYFYSFSAYYAYLGVRLRMSIMAFPWIVVSFYITVQVL